MTTKLIVLYRKPEDEAAFLDYYETVHTPLVRKVPGLQKLVVNRVTGAPMGETDLFLIAELHFAGRAEFDAAMRSDENRAAGRDLANFAKGLATLVIAEEA